LPVVGALALLPASTALAAKGDTELSSRASSGGAGANLESADAAVSGNGRFVAFESDATNLSGADGPEGDIFLYDHKRRKVALISRKSNNGPGANGDSENPSISANGRFITYHSNADNLSGVDTDGVRDVFVYDRKERKTSLVSRRSNNGAGGDAASTGPAISADGRYVVFESSAGNLSGASVAAQNVFVHDRKRRKTELISRRSHKGTGADAPSSTASISGNGRFVSFRSSATNLSGASVALQNVFVHDRKKATVRLVSRESGKGPGGDATSNVSDISADGRYIAFQSDATNLSAADDALADDVFLYDRKTLKVRLLSREAGNGPGGDDRSFQPSISADGRFVAFRTRADNLSVDDDNDVDDVMAMDVKNKTLRLVSRASNNGPGGDGVSGQPAISLDGRFVVFDSDSTNLTDDDDDTANHNDVYRYQYRH
jgi:Tol biopolymer transport system component